MRKILSLIILSSFITYMFLNRKTYAETSWVKTNPIVTYATALEPTPWGILVGEMANKPPPGDGIYISRDLGNTWEVLGLQGRGVRDIKYYEGNIYATTYYVRDNTVGLFMSKDTGLTWNKIGPSFVPTKVSRDSHTIYLGGEHYGLWISNDDGQTWIQKMGSGGDGTKINSIESSEDITLVSRPDKVYKSTNKGETWEEIAYLSNKGIAYFHIRESVIFAGSSGGLGLYVSLDTGNTWRKIDSFGNYSVGDITFFDGKYYIGRINPSKQTYTVYSTNDLGNTLIDTNLNVPPFWVTLSLGAIFSEPSYLFSVVAGEGIYKYEIPKKQIEENPFLEIPWNYIDKNELLDNITSFFDHSYPLLGYNYFLESNEENKSTLNFLGIKNVEPYIYYSSHSGIDFGLKYGTELLSPAPGYATYYYCIDCGNTIKIDHLNGYQSIYMHLQNDEIITKNDKIWVNKGDKIGKVGLTGRTTGPHLHFEILVDKGGDGDFSNDFPSGRVDPFGWQNFEFKDPWKDFAWNDLLGSHLGSESKYLWLDKNSRVSKLINSSSETLNSTISVDNKQLTFTNSFDHLNSIVSSHVQPLLNHPDSFSPIFKYVKNTSLIIELYDQMKNKINDFSNFNNDTIRIDLDLTAENLSDIDLSTIKLYFWNELSNLWEILPSYFDPLTNKLTANIDHLSWFAVFGEKIDMNSPKTQILVSGTQINGWYKQFPLIEFSCYEDEKCYIENTLYSLDTGNTWETYLEPFYLQKDGITNIIFKSIDIYENLEEENSYVIKNNIAGKITEKIKVSNASFLVKN